MQQVMQLNVKVVPELLQEIDIVSKVLHVDRNEWVRNVLGHEVKKELEAHKTFVALAYARGLISKAELVNALGKEDAEDVEHILETNKKGLLFAKKLAARFK